MAGGRSAGAAGHGLRRERLVRVAPRVHRGARAVEDPHDSEAIGSDRPGLRRAGLGSELSRLGEDAAASSLRHRARLGGVCGRSAGRADVIRETHANPAVRRRRQHGGPRSRVDGGSRAARGGVDGRDCIAGGVDRRSRCQSAAVRQRSDPSARRVVPPHHRLEGSAGARAADPSAASRLETGVAWIGRKVGEWQAQGGVPCTRSISCG